MTLQNFSGLANLADVQESLEEKRMQITLVQVYKNKQITLATYNSNVNEVLYPGRSRLSKYGETSLLMKNEPLFPVSKIFMLIILYTLLNLLSRFPCNTNFE